MDTDPLASVRDVLGTAAALIAVIAFAAFFGLSFVAGLAG